MKYVQFSIKRDRDSHKKLIFLGSRNVLHCNAKGIENYFCNCLHYKTHAVCFTEMRVRLGGPFHFKSTLLKGSSRAKI